MEQEKKVESTSTKDDKFRSNGLVVLRTEIKEYNGIEYKAVLVGIDNGNNEEETPIGEVNKEQWWNLEPTEKSDKLSKYASQGFIYLDTRFMLDKRMQDKYHRVEIMAMTQINWLMEKYPKERFKWLAREVKFYLYVIYKTFFPRVIYYFKKIVKSKS